MKKLLFGTNLALMSLFRFNEFTSDDRSRVLAEQLFRSAAVSLVENKLARKGKPTASVCERRVCKLPTTDLSVFAEPLQAD